MLKRKGEDDIVLIVLKSDELMRILSRVEEAGRCASFIYLDIDGIKCSTPRARSVGTCCCCQAVLVAWTNSSSVFVVTCGILHTSLGPDVLIAQVGSHAPSHVAPSSWKEEKMSLGESMSHCRAIRYRPLGHYMCSSLFESGEASRVSRSRGKGLQASTRPRSRRLDDKTFFYRLVLAYS